MSDDNKNLGDDLNDMLDDAKAGAKKASDSVNREAKEFSNDAKEVFSDGKNVAIIAHITIIGWIIALIMNGSNKTEFGSFYIRQMLGFILIGVLLGWIPILGLLVSIVLFVAWIMSLIAALGGQMKPSFLLGQQFQDWFKGL